MKSANPNTRDDAIFVQLPRPGEILLSAIGRKLIARKLPFECLILERHREFTQLCRQGHPAAARMHESSSYLIGSCLRLRDLRSPASTARAATPIPNGSGTGSVLNTGPIVRPSAPSTVMSILVRPVPVRMMK